jgi:hypothetical protein
MDIAIGTARIENGRTVGQRVVHSNVLDKTLVLMNDLGENEAVLAVGRWPLGPGKVPGRSALEQALKKVEKHRKGFADNGMFRQAGYCDVAAYCVQACLDEAK